MRKLIVALIVSLVFVSVLAQETAEVEEKSEKAAETKNGTAEAKEGSEETAEVKTSAEEPETKKESAETEKDKKPVEKQVVEEKSAKTAKDTAPQEKEKPVKTEKTEKVEKPEKKSTQTADTENSAVYDTEEETEKIVVTGTRKKSSWKKAPAMVTVVEKEELEQAPETTVDDFLKRIPSVSYSRVHQAECGPGRDITLRGISEQKRTLILVDGIPVNDSVTGAVNWSLIPKESVERIEVIRGPMSALYGSGAMGGVINVVTKKPEENNETLLKGGYGMMNTYKATLLQGGKFKKMGILSGRKSL